MPNNWELYYPVIVVIITSSILFVFPALRRSGFYTAVAAIATGCIYRTEVVSYLLLILALYGLLLYVDAVTCRSRRRAALSRELVATAVGASVYDEGPDTQVSTEPPFNAQARWRYSGALMFATAALFFLASWRFPQGAFWQMAGIQWVFRFADMWFFLRTLSFLWEYGSGRTQLEFIPYFTWMVLPCTAHGPLLRFCDFRDQYSASIQRPDARPTIGKGWWRLLALAAVQIASAITMERLNVWVADHNTTGRLWKGIVLFGTGPIGFYLRTAGTFHVMECFGCFWGLTLPPSFDKPFGRPNIAEFWKHWNMSVTSFFRDHLFFNRWGLERPNLYLNSLVLFTFMGLWHSINWHWFLYGLLHGIAFCVFIWWRAHRNEPLIRALALPPAAANVISRAGTYVFVCVATIAPSKLIVFLSRR